MESARAISEEIRIGSITNPSFRVRANRGSIELLARSILNEGLLEPIIVRPKDGRFELVAGARRLTACQLLGWRKIASQIIELTDQEALEIAIAENVARKTLDPLEEARSFEEYTKRYGWGSQVELAKKVGKSTSYVSRRLRLLKIPKDTLEEMMRRRNNPSMLAELLAFEDDDLREQVTELSIQADLSSKDIRRIRQKASLASSAGWLSESKTAGDIKKRRVKNAIQKSVVALRVALHHLDDVLDNLDEEDWVLKEILLQNRQTTHTQIGLVTNLMKRYDKVVNLRG